MVYGRKAVEKKSWKNTPNLLCDCCIKFIAFYSISGNLMFWMGKQCARRSGGGIRQLFSRVVRLLTWGQEAISLYALVAQSHL